MPLNIKAQADGGLEIELYDVIGFWGTSAKAFRDRVKAAKGKPISLRINSPGGSVIEGNAIYNTLKDHEGGVTAYVDGMAASMASVIAMAADKVVMAQNALMMIHNPSTVAEGESEDLRKAAELMDKMKDGLVNAYVKKTGKTRAKIEKLMDDETWFDAQEAVDEGFADSIAKDSRAKNSVDVTAFAAYYPEKKFTATVHDAPGGQENKTKSNTMPQEIEALQKQIASLEAEKAASAKALADAQATATTEATNAAKTAEKVRKDAILALRDKYNKDGDLNDVAVKALAGDTTPEAFKDQVLDVVNGRATKAAIKPGVETTESQDKKTGETSDEEFKALYSKACDEGTSARMAFVRKNRARVNSLLRAAGE